MHPDSVDARFAFALALVGEAGALAHDYFKRRDTLTITSKGVQDMASEADLETERLIRRRLDEAFPQDGFLGEETGMSEPRQGGGIWVVDPIDGTQPFISGMSSWCVSIGFVRDGRPELGVIYAPARDELFAGRAGSASTLNGRPIAVSGAKALSEGMMGVGYSPRITPGALLPAFGRLLAQGGTFYRDGSGALMLCYVAAGRLIGYMEPHINAWDCLGALAIVEGAGGRTNDYLAGDGLVRGNRVIASAPRVYDAIERLFDTA